MQRFSIWNSISNFLFQSSRSIISEKKPKFGLGNSSQYWYQTMSCNIRRHWSIFIISVMANKLEICSFQYKKWVAGFWFHHSLSSSSVCWSGLHHESHEKTSDDSSWNFYLTCVTCPTVAKFFLAVALTGFDHLCRFLWVRHFEFITFLFKDRQKIRTC